MINHKIIIGRSLYELQKTANYEATHGWVGVSITSDKESNQWVMLMTKKEG